MWLWVGLAFAEVPCLTIERWTEWQYRPLRVSAPHKQSMVHLDSFETPSEQVLFSEHFAVHWGEDYNDDQRIVDIVQLLEQTWTLYVDIWNMESPNHDTYFNVYLAGTGNDLPPDLGVAGYYDVDDNGLPMVVLGPYVTESWSIAKTTVPHEFFHAVQHRTGSFTQFADRWYWEASATWSEQEVLPSHPSHADFLFGYALRPYLPLAHFELFSSGAIEEYHPYGAFIFLQYLTENDVGNEGVVASWQDGGESAPLDWWRGYYDTQGLDFGETLSAMAAHNVHWDYTDHLIYQTKVDAYVEAQPDLDQRVAGVLSVGESVSVPSALRPGPFGYNLWTFSEVDTDLELFFDGTTVGDHFNSVRWRLSLVRESNDGPLYTDLSTNGGEGLWTLSESELSNSTLVVFADAPEGHIDETFTYALQLRIVEEESKRMGCVTGLPFQNWGLLILSGLILVRRQRQYLDWH